MISFENTKVAFSYKSTRNLKKARMMFRMIQNPTLVKIGSTCTKVALDLHLPIRGLVKRTIFSQFCGGEDIQECEKQIEELGDFGIGSILDYSAEGKERESVFDQTVEEILSTIEKAKGHPNIPFCVFKPTGIGRFKLLQRVSEGKKLKESEKQEFERFRERFRKICKASYNADQKLFIDAEESWYQDILDQLCREMMEEFNKEHPIVFNTAQMYRWDRMDFLRNEIQRARDKGYYFGIKLVRGAYMEKERERAHEMGYPSPIQPDKSATDKDYDGAVELCLEHIDIVSVCAGTHNEQSSHNLIELMESKGLERDDGRIYFSQLLGMSDNISFNLAKAGFNVTKYVPYGPVRDVLPYLIRRAQENTSVKGQSSRELNLIEKELKRRKGEKP